MTHEGILEWKGDMAFETVLDGHLLKLDASEEGGGHDTGLRPKKLVLAALAGCTGMDVVMILKKMKIVPDSFQVKVEANATEEHPKRYDKMKVVYEFKGDNLELEKLKKAVELSQEKYCGVSATLKNSVELSYEIRII
jgi:putative redox protein